MGQRILGVVVLLMAGMASLPLAALPFEGQGKENWIVPVQLGVMALLGALVSLALPGLVGPGGSQFRRAWVGAAIGVAMAFVGLAVFFLMLSGFSGA